MNKLILAAALSLTFSINANASLITLPSTDLGTWTDDGSSNILVLLGRSADGITSQSFTLLDKSYVTIAADDCCLLGDSYGLILDNAATPWTISDYANSVNGNGLFHGVFTGLLDSGQHSFGFNVAGHSFNNGGMSWGIALGQDLPNVAVFPVPVPEPSTYAMLLAGLGMLGFAGMRRKINY